LIRHISLTETAGVTTPVPHLMERAYMHATGHPSHFGDGPDACAYAGDVGVFPTVPFAAVMQAVVSAAFLKGKIVLVGATATGVGDRYPTPCPMAPVCRGGGAGPFAQRHDWRADDPPTDSGGDGGALGGAGVALDAGLLVDAGVALRCSLLGMALVLALSATVLVVAGWWFPLVPRWPGLLLAYPLWGWRRLQAISDYVDIEIARFQSERGSHPAPFLAPGQRCDRGADRAARQRH
jgi:hypothetical protein